MDPTHRLRSAQLSYGRSQSDILSQPTCMRLVANESRVGFETNIVLVLILAPLHIRSGPLRCCPVHCDDTTPVHAWLSPILCFPHLASLCTGRAEVFWSYQAQFFSSRLHGLGEISLLHIIDATTFEHEGICVPRSSPVIRTKTNLNLDISSLGVSPLLCQFALNKNNDNACILIECHGTECRFRKRTRLPILFRDRIMPVCPSIVASPLGHCGLSTPSRPCLVALSFGGNCRGRFAQDGSAHSRLRECI